MPLLLAAIFERSWPYAKSQDADDDDDTAAFIISSYDISQVVGAVVGLVVGEVVSDGTLHDPHV